MIRDGYIVILSTSFIINRVINLFLFLDLKDKQYELG